MFCLIYNGECMHNLLTIYTPWKCDQPNQLILCNVLVLFHKKIEKLNVVKSPINNQVLSIIIPVINY